MSKQPPKPPVGPEHSREREFTAVDLRSQFRTFGEGLADVQEKVSEIPIISERLERVENNVAVIKAVIPTLATKKDLDKLEKRLTQVETR